MWHFRLFRTLLTVFALLGFVGSQTALAAYPVVSEFSVNQPQETRELNGSFQMAVMGNSTNPLDIPAQKITKKAQPKAQSSKPAVKKRKTAPKASKAKKKTVKTAKTQTTPKKKPAAVEEEGFLTKTIKTLVGGDQSVKNPASKSLMEKSVGKNSKPPKEEGLLTKTLKSLVSDDEKKKKSAAKSKPQKSAGKKPEPEKKKDEGGLLTKTLKSLVGGDEKEKKKEKTAKKKALNPINMVPTGSVVHKKEKEKEKSKTAKSETKKTLKESFEKLIGVGTVDKETIEATPNKTTQQAKAVKKVKKKPAPAPQPKRITARKYIEEEEAQLEKDRGGVKKGKNILKESFKTLITEEQKKKAPTE